ncbi:MAG: hypothetical protein K0R93_2105 [Anaerosolibacter sp.]|jgi:hypothetical protein|uniref:RNA-directed DNA polymerase n=1 Tax=Anaerosolibacter sp. TaxID=1872527 RepID=UPI002602C287|nr:RNA-directed DNA polymerase [Anaerosolibacter sp.]MDF2547207.1 hypothetical protein [Anaerosolibacter sp.]
MDLREKLIDYRNIHLAYERTKNGAMNKELHSTIEEEVFSDCIPTIYDEIQNILCEPDNFQFQPLEVLNKPKKILADKTWEVRPLARMNFYDSVISQSVLNVIAELIRPVLERQNFSYTLLNQESIYFYENWKVGYSKFLDHELKALDETSSYQYVVEIDIKQFYPSIDLDRLKREISIYIKDDKNKNSDIILKWLDKILSIKRVNIIGKEIAIEGLPQGPLYSPLFALFYIRDCFKQLKKKDILHRTSYFGYVDDFRFYCETEKQAKRISDEFKLYLKNRDLDFSDGKTDILKIDDKKIYEGRIIGKGSNLNRAIMDNIILTSESRTKMQNNLRGLINETRELFEENRVTTDFIERIDKFALYRIIKLIDDLKDWTQYVSELKSEKYLILNFAAMLYALHIAAYSNKQKRKLIMTLQEIICSSNLDELTYIRYLCLQYCFKYSPKELKLPKNQIEYNIKLFNDNINQSTVYLKGILTTCHEDWYSYLKKEIDLTTIDEDRELNVILYKIFNVVELPSPYKGKLMGKKLEEYDSMQKYCINCSGFITDNYLDDESFKNIDYVKIKRIRRLSSTDKHCYVIRIDNNLISFKEFSKHASDIEKIELIKNLFSWVKFQLECNELLPCSIFDPNHIWINMKDKRITLIGNPYYENQILYHKTPSMLWKKNLIVFFNTLFGDNSDGRFEVVVNCFWKLRIFKMLKVKRFYMKDFINNLIQIILDFDQSKEISVNNLHHDTINIASHYLQDMNLIDRFVEIIRYTEANWKNGSKECHLYTLHNHEHGRLLLKIIHSIIEESGFRIYLNKKEAFRLFVACYVHDLGMLAIPSDSNLYDMNSKILPKYKKEIEALGEVAVTRLEQSSELNKIYHIHNIVDRLREQIVRDKHASISEKEIVGDYPELPLNIAERRDIGLIGLSHGMYKDDMGKIPDYLHDGRHPIKLKLLSHLLRIADCCDVECTRISKDVIERNIERMDKLSIFHWVKHMSVNEIRIVERGKDIDNARKIGIEIIHNYLPQFSVAKEEIENSCGDRCKNKCDYEKDLGKLVDHNDKLTEENSIIKYLNKDICNVTCLFINAAYNWFYSEILFINQYFKKNGIKVVFDLSIIFENHDINDFLVVKNRNFQISAQEFMMEYFFE